MHRKKSKGGGTHLHAYKHYKPKTIYYKMQDK